MALTGELNRRIKFKIPVTTKSDSGGVKTTYEDKISVWAKWERISGFRDQNGNFVLLDTTFRVTVRYNIITSAIRKECLIEYQGEDYVIHQIDDIKQRHEFIQFIVHKRE